MMHPLLRWLSSPVFAGDEEKTQQANLLNLILLILLAFLSLETMSHFLGGRTPAPVMST